MERVVAGAINQRSPAMQRGFFGYVAEYSYSKRMEDTPLFSAFSTFG